jgi:hypothetical protein
MFQARPISLRVEVWERIDNYLNAYAAQNPAFMPNRGALIEEAVVAYLDQKQGGGASEETSENDSIRMDDELSDESESMPDDDGASDDDMMSDDEDSEDDED